MVRLQQMGQAAQHVQLVSSARLVWPPPIAPPATNPQDRYHLAHSALQAPSHLVAVVQLPPRMANGPSRARQRRLTAQADIIALVV